MFDSVLNSAAGNINVYQAALCTFISIICGMIIALSYRAADHPSRNFLTAVVILPAVVQFVILMVNGNLGVGVAIAGSFSLVRFRSLPGKAGDIVIVFLAMTAGLLTGMGYVWLALAVSAVLSLVYILMGYLPVFDEDEKLRTLRITIPEDLDYTAVFDDVLNRYASRHRLVSARTVSLGTMFQLTYELRLKKPEEEKAMIDELRIRNGNLSVVCGHGTVRSDEL